MLARFGARTETPAAILVFAAGVALIGVGTDVLHSYAFVVGGLALFGLGNGAVDVMMNVEGAAIEKQVGKTILPLFHAFFSFGTVIGAGVGALAVAMGLNVLVHTSVMAVVIAIIAFVTHAMVPAREITMDPVDPTDKTPWRERLHTSLSAWREPRTYALGVIMLGMAFAEGGANDWLALGMVEGHGTTQAVGALGLAVFSVSMTLVRMIGGPLVDRFGRVAQRCACWPGSPPPGCRRSSSCRTPRSCSSGLPCGERGSHSASRSECRPRRMTRRRLRPA